MSKTQENIENEEREEVQIEEEENLDAKEEVNPVHDNIIDIKA